MKIRVFLAAASLALLSSRALAQDERGASLSAVVSAATVDAGTEAALSAAFDYRLTRVVGFELEATLVPELRSPYPDDDDRRLAWASSSLFGLIYPMPEFEDPGGRMVIVSNNVRVAVPTTSRSLEPYFVVGGGIANVRRTANSVNRNVDPRVLAAMSGAGMSPGMRPGVSPIRTSSVEMALTIGGGLSIRVRQHVSVEADLRMFRLLGAADRSLGRFGGGVRYRF